MKLRDLLNNLVEDKAKFGFKAEGGTIDFSKGKECPWCGGTPNKPRKRQDAAGVMCAHECHQKKKKMKMTAKQYEKHEYILHKAYGKKYSEDE